MKHFNGRGILLDIEGTTSSVRFVYDVLFPYARQHLDAYLADQWSETATRQACEQIARDAGAQSFAEWVGPVQSTEACDRVRVEVLRLMDADVKATGLKTLQGLIWEAGFQSGQLRAHVYDDVPPTLQRFAAAGLDVRIFSSGSVAAQKLFFAHTIHGNLRRYFRGHYDTTTGPKRHPDSYRAIARQFELPASQILFVSDVVEELNAAREAGMATALSIRPENTPIDDPAGHDVISTFAEITLDAAA